jgi:hypothetical protein
MQHQPEVRTAQIIPFPKRCPDLRFTNLGAFATCVPITQRGHDWIIENIGPDARLPLAVDPCFLPDIVIGARADGLVCHG